MRNTNNLITLIITIEVVLLALTSYFLFSNHVSIPASMITGILFLIVFYNSNRYLFQVIVTNKKENSIANQMKFSVQDDSSKVKKEFFQNLSHEIKTPFSAIKGFTDILHSMEPDEYKNIKTISKKISKNVLRIENLLKDIDLITRIETGQSTLKLSNFDICRMCNEIINDHKTIAKKKNITIKKEYSSSNPIIVHADKNKIYQVIENLYMNALYYVPDEKMVRIKVSKPSKEQCLIEIKDNGIGIPKSHLGRVFERFYRIDPSRSNNKNGTGIGLSICKHIINLHNQNIKVTSNPFEETNFFFILPIQKK